MTLNKISFINFAGTDTCLSYARYRDNEVRLYVINMDKSKGCKLKLVPNNKRMCDAIYKYLFLNITMVISNPIRIKVNPTVTPAAIPMQNRRMIVHNCNAI